MKSYIQKESFMPTVKKGYSKKSVILKTAAGNISTVHGLDPEGSVVIMDDKTEQEVVQAVTNYVIQDVQEKAANEAKKKAAEIIRTYVAQVRNDNALAGEYQKSYRVMGNKIKGFQYAVDVQQNDKWACPQTKEDIEALKAVLGSHFDAIMESETTISIKKEVIESDALRRELNALLHKVMGTDDLRKFFEKKEVWRVKRGMAERQYKLPDEIRKNLRANVKQADDTIKDASFPATN